jgi:hypothetical protein
LASRRATIAASTGGTSRFTSSSGTGARQVEVHELERVARDERRVPREQLVEGRAQGVQVAAMVDAAAHAAGLFGREVGQRAFEEPEVGRLAVELRGEAEVDQADLAAARLADDVRRVDVLVDDARRVDARERARQHDGDAQELPDRQRAPGRDPRERLRAEVIEHDREAAADLDDLVNGDDPVARQPPGGLELGAEPRQPLGRWVLHGEYLGDDRSPIAPPRAAEHDRVGARVDLLAKVISLDPHW